MQASTIRTLNTIVFLALAAVAVWQLSVAADSGRGTLRLTIVDGSSEQLTPARVEVVDAKGQSYAADDALLVGQGSTDREHPWTGDLAKALSLLSKSIENPYTRTRQFYTAGNVSISLPQGTYKLRFYKGTEYKVESRTVEIQPARSAELKVAMPRWVDMPREGWYSADDHLHISRPLRELNPMIAKWMQAEDIHVANLLHFGSWSQFFGAPQYALGEGGLHREGDYLLATGQENPRTHFLGHGIILGGQSPINVPDRYLIYQEFWKQARLQRALSGYAHWGTSAGASTGLAIDLPTGLLDFIEVLESSDANYDIWYDILNTGFRMTPTAGTDYGSVPSLPGRERFYTEIKGPFTYAAWLDGVRRGRTFVTNGPVLEFQIQSKGMGEELTLPQPGRVLVEARVRFDSARDDVARLEVIRNGYLLRSFPRDAASSEIRCKFEVDVAESSWIAVRASGHKLGEAVPAEGLLPPFRDRDRGGYATHAHSAPIFVTIEGRPGLSRHPNAKTLALSWIARLDELSARLAEDRIQSLSRPKGDGKLTVEALRANRAALLEAVRNAKGHYVRQAQN